MIHVYSILWNDNCIYIGRTNNIKRRSAEHRRALKNGKKKLVYDFLREQNYEGDIELMVLMSYKSKTEAKRMEMFLILSDHFGPKKLKQQVPNISDR
jgi:predicted GIY-YIG superfamily endonuclease